MITIGAILIANPGQEDALENALLAILEPVSREAGTLEYKIHRTVDNKGRFFLYERYVDRSAIDSHIASPGFKTLLDKLEGLVAQEPEIIQYEEIGSIH